MDGIDQIDFNINFSDLPESVEELRQKLTPEERKQLEKLPESDLGITMSEDNPTTLIKKVYGKEDTHTLSLTYGEMVDSIFSSPWFLKELHEEQKKVVGQFLETITSEKKKYYARDELIIIAKSILLAVSD